MSWRLSRRGERRTPYSNWRELITRKVFTSSFQRSIANKIFLLSFYSAIWQLFRRRTAKNAIQSNWWGKFSRVVNSVSLWLGGCVCLAMTKYVIGVDWRSKTKETSLNSEEDAFPFPSGWSYTLLLLISISDGFYSYPSWHFHSARLQCLIPFRVLLFGSLLKKERTSPRQQSSLRH